ncbi:DMT family transporter [uncultured Clostridium sp.]|uniref:DMT family transporter n=1 Tax=uncultured Clostridium sp. TaxID=59620 RepID=UPI00262350E6|nr:DMT family transporter [uncultured Clostridium sp.]
MKNSRTKGIILILFMALSFSITGAFIKGVHGVPEQEEVFYRNLVIFATSIIMILKSKAPAFGNKGNRLALIGRGAFGTLGAFASYYAITHMILPNAVIISNLCPFFIIIFSAIFLKEKLKSVQVIAVLIALSGMIFIVNPGGKLALIPAGVALLGAIFNGISYVLVRHLGHKEKPETIILVMAITSLFFTVPSMVAHYVPLSTKDLLLLLGAGVAYSVAEVLGVLAYKCAPAREISVFSYSDAIFSAGLSFLLFGQLPHHIQYIGYVLIIIGAIILYGFNTKKQIPVEDNEVVIN